MFQQSLDIAKPQSELHLYSSLPTSSPYISSLSIYTALDFTAPEPTHPSRQIDQCSPRQPKFQLSILGNGNLTFPPNLDPTLCAEHAATFDTLDRRLIVDFVPLPSKPRNYRRSFRLRAIQRAWVVPKAHVGCESQHYERSHVYLLLWAGREAELAVKRGEGKVRSLSWEERFVGDKEECKRGGMVSKSLQSETHTFL